MFNFSGQAALVTGGTAGIGAAIAGGLADAGCRVVAAGLPVPDDARVGLSTELRRPGSTFVTPRAFKIWWQDSTDSISW